jgi:hypothetical protein
MSVTAAIEALRHDAGVWDEVSEVTRRSGQEAGALALGEGELSWASVATGLLNSYAEIQSKVVTLLGEATSTYSGLSTTLDKVAAAYQLSDENAAARFKGVWDVRE